MSSMLSVTVKPDPIKLGRAIGELKIHTFLQREVNRVAMTVERYAKQLTPVDTGKLRSSIFTSPAKTYRFEAIVSTNTEYAIYVHEGTRYMRGRPFMTMGAAFAQTAELKDVNIRLDKEFTDAFKKVK